MVKVAEKEKKRGVMTPVFGLLLAVGEFAIAYIISDQFVTKMAAVRTVVSGLNNRLLANSLFAVGIWLVLLAISFFVVAILAGKDPESASTIPLPPKKKDLKKKR